MSDAEALNAEGTECAKRGQLLEALGFYERALFLEPSLAKAENNRGNVLRRLGRLEPAADAFTRARALGSEKAALNLASLLAQEGRFCEIDTLVRELRPDESAPDLWRAVARTTTGFVQDAAELHRASAEGVADANADERSFAGGLRVALPRTRTITHHVLTEREDWFEDEIRFTRKLLRPGDAALDVGANFGVFTLSMARSVGPDGRVVAVEPAWATRTFLEESVRRNAMSHVVVLPYALSNAAGSATFFNAASPELSGLRGADVQGGAPEVVALRTLDEVTADFREPRISFMKLDAEGEEVRILEGASRFLDLHDPLVMTELVHGTTVNRGLLDALLGLGMELYCLAPGPMILQPLTEERVRAGFLLNVFACRSGRRDELMARGLLGQRGAGLSPSVSAVREARAHLEGVEPRGAGSEALHEAALAFVLGSKAREPSAQLDALERALTLAKLAAADGRAGLGALLLTVRVATALGHRSLAVSVALDALARLDGRKGALPNDIFVGPSARFDEIAVSSTLEAWARASLLDHLLHEKAYSSIFDPSLVDLARQALEGPYAQPLAQRIVELHR